jgi:hypothetical protein
MNFELVKIDQSIIFSTSSGRIFFSKVVIEGDIFLGRIPSYEAVVYLGIPYIIVVM